MDLKLVELNELDEKMLKRVNDFILGANTTGEFINSLDYLSYHGNRFNEDSVAVLDAQSGSVKGVMLMVARGDGTAVSHSGTTFAGPVISLKDSYQTVNLTIEMMLDYYENKYDEIYLKTLPPLYSKQESDVMKYVLLKHGYSYEMNGLSNIIMLDGIKDEDGLLQMYDSKKRNQVKKSVKGQKFVFKKCDEIATEVWESMSGTLEEKFGATITHTLEEISELRRRFPSSIIPYEVRTTDGEYAAFGLVYKFKNVFHTQYLDVNYKFTGEYPNLYLVHNLIQEAIAEGFRVFSFGVSTENGGQYLNESLYSYKSGYGGGSILMPIFSKMCK